MTLEDYLKEGNVAFFGYRGKELPDFVHTKKAGRARSFDPKHLSEIREEHADVYFLDGRATRVLFANFPASARYVLVRLNPSTNWLIALPGLLRRLLNGLVEIERVHSVVAGGLKTRWLVLRHKRVVTLHTRLSVSEDIGVQGLIDRLNSDKVRYVVLRFFEKLPALYRPNGGDLDLLVSDEDEVRVKEFLQSHPGKIGVDVWTPSRVSHNSITYYPPPLAKRIIASAIVGPAGAQIPAPKEAFLALAYHALYHKGLFAGVPTTLPGLAVNQHPQNDYAGVLARMAKDLGLEVEITMEALDEYLAKEGWRPKLDTLAKIAPHNKWAWQRFFAGGHGAEVGLGIIILKRKALELGLEERMLASIKNYGGFALLRTKRFTVEEVATVAEHLRGGVWDSAGGRGEYLPAMAIAVLDEELARAHATGVVYRSAEKRIKELKKMLRKDYDQGGVSLTHATDATHEAKEYLRWCFSPNEIASIEEYLHLYLHRLQPSNFEKLLLALRAAPRYITYRLGKLKQFLRTRGLRLIMGR